MTEVSTFSLYLMRAMYLLIFVGLGSEIWPGIIHHAKPWSLMHGVACSLLAALSAMMALGIRYPLQMLPVRDGRKRSVLAVWTGLNLVGILPSGHSGCVHLEK